MKRRAVILFMAAVMASSGLFAGCGGKENSSAPNAQQETSVTAKEQDDAAKLSAPAEGQGDVSAQEEQPEVSAEPEKPAENVPEEKPEEEIKMYVTAPLSVREKPDKGSKKTGTLPICAEVKVVEKEEDWYQIEAKDASGYVFAKYLTEDKEKAAAAKKEAEARAKAAAAKKEAEAKAKAAAAKKEAEAKAKAAAKAKTTKKKSTKKKVVSREKYPNCETGEHGVEVITYSDGSVEKRKY